MQTIGPDIGERTSGVRGPAFPQRRRLALRDARRQVGRGRAFAREALADWGWDGRDTAEDALLVVSELVTNASLHAGGCHELLLRSGDAFRVEVYDGLGDLRRLVSASRRGGPGDVRPRVSRAGTVCASCAGSPTAGAPRSSGRAKWSGPSSTRNAC